MKQRLTNLFFAFLCLLATFFTLPSSVFGQSGIPGTDYAVSISPASATVNDVITITFTDYDLVNKFYTSGQTTIYMWAGVETSSAAWQYNPSTWATLSTWGAATGSAGTFTITITPTSYFTGLPSGTLVKGINLLFANQWSGGGNNQTADMYIDLVDANVGGSSTVTVTPSLPNDTQSVTIDFDATGTALAGASKVYMHSGVSTDIASPNNFEYTVGNWGADDGIGQMTSTGTNTWRITMSSGIRAYYSVPANEDIFGINFLFRSADGTLKEDNSGANYHNDVNPGSYFTITSPTVSPYFAQVGVAFPATGVANVAPTNWTLDEINPTTDAYMSTISTQTGSTTFTTNITPSTTVLRKFKITANFGGTTKYKTFTILGYNAVTDQARPAGTEPGINYNPSDPTKAVLVLHAPVFTVFKKGTGTQSGTNPTTPKNVVYVVGDFNGWTPSEAYKMKRDRDGYVNNTNYDTDADGEIGDYWWIELTGLTPGQEYVFQYLMEGGLQVADPYTEKVSDHDDQYIASSVYPGLIAYPSQAQDRASVLQTGQTAYTWTAPSFTKPTTNNLNIYELHFRDFTEEGTYLAAIEKLDYIKNLGINAIHVMPVSEFEGNTSWGYNPNFYFAPDKAYGTKDDLKRFIDECHKREIQVFNDLVLNHAFYSNVMARMYWNSAANKPANDNPWFNADHKMVYDSNGHWGADWNHESCHTQAMVDRILDFWLQEYKFDGFRFDFTKGFGQTAPDSGDPWAGSYDQDRVDLLERMIDGMWARNAFSVAIFEHLADNPENEVLADHGILMWSGVWHHNQMKNMLLGHADADPGIYESGVYNTSARAFDYANWMSYSESHDEERLAYELSQWFNGTKNLTNTVKRLKIGAAFNELLPGPRMLWQFQELAYDISIEYNGRTGEKPVHWEYFDDATRKQLYRLYSKLHFLRNNYALYSTTPDYDNIGLGANNITTPRVMRLSSTGGQHVIVIANLDPAAGHTVTPNYDVTGTWYKYNGDPAVDGTPFTVSSTGATYSLAASEVMVLTNVLIPELPTAAPSTLTATAAGTTSIDLTWADNSNNETGFIVQYALSPDGPFTTITTLAANSTSYSHTGLDPNTTYYYQVVATNLAGISDWAGPANATTDDVVPSCSTTLVENDNPVGAGTYSASQTITSTGTIAASTTVVFEAGTSITLQVGFHAQANCDFTARIVPCTPFAEAPVAARNYVGNVVENPTAQALEATIIPNPLYDRATVRYFIPEEGKVSIAIFDTNGREISNMALGLQAAGWQESAIDASNLPKGIYFLNVKTDKTAVVRKMVVMQ